MRWQPSRRRLVATAAGLVVVLLGGWLLWRATALPAAERAIQRATGFRVTVGSLRPGLRTLHARNVVLLGAPPFESAPVARIARLRADLGGPGGLFSPREVSLSGLQLTYLRAGDADNVRGRQRARSGRFAEPERPVSRGPVVRVLDGRLEGFIRLSDGKSVAIRGEQLSAERNAAGALTAALDRLVLEVGGVATLTAPRVELATVAGIRSLRARQVSLNIPAGGRLLSDLTASAELGPQRSQLTVETASPSRPGGDRRPPFRFSATAVDGGLRADLQASDLRLAALRPLVRDLGVHPDATRGRFSFHLDAQPDQPSRLTFELALRGVHLLHPRLDREPWRDLSVSARGLASISMAEQRVVLDRAELETLGMPLQVTGELSLHPSLRADLRLQTQPDRTPACPKVLAAQAGPVRDTLAGMALEGRLGLDVSLAFDSAAWEELGLDVKVAPRCRVVREPGNLEALLPRLRGGRRPGGSGWTRNLPIDSQHADYVPLSRMPAWLPAAFVTAEDGRFFAHPGFDLEMIRRALAHDLEVADFAKGASTITQQLAKNLFLSPERTFARKLEELVLAWRLHEELSKPRILELYLNVIELGPGIRGVKRAARLYFGKDVTTLTALEAAHLAALTPNPVGYARRFREGRVDESWLLKLYDLLGMMNRSGRLSAAELAAARSERLTLKRI